MMRNNFLYRLFFLTVLCHLLAAASALAADKLEVIKKLEEEADRPAPETITRPSVEYRAEEEGIRDPFKGLSVETPVEQGKEINTEQEQLPSLAVQGVIWGGRFPQAIINNRVVKAGDTLEGESVRVLDIDNNGIVVLFNGRQYTLPAPGLAASSSTELKEDEK